MHLGNFSIAPYIKSLLAFVYSDAFIKCHIFFHTNVHTACVRVQKIKVNSVSKLHNDTKSKPMTCNFKS